MVIARLAEWASFYVLVGSSGAALIGIQFVVITLVAGMRRRPTEESVSAFATPTMVHLVGALVVAAVMSVPWHSLRLVAVAVLICGLGGMVYGPLVIRRTFRQTAYQQVWQDWVWYAVLPFSAYITLSLSGAFLIAGSLLALYTVAAAALGLLLIGVHNAWDTVTYIILSSFADDTASETDRNV